MGLNQMSNRKRIERLEMKLGIEKDNPDMDYWEEINSCACECLKQEMKHKKYVLPDYLKFAEHIFYRVLNFFKKLYKNILEERQKSPKDSLKNDKTLLSGFGWVHRLAYMEITLYKTLSQIGPCSTVKFLKDKLFFSYKDVHTNTRQYIYKVEFPNEPKLFYIGVKKFQYW
ncbi:MAG: hypothetical protein A2Y25_02960 [Candidatus Melainabacteria bacterium GWF2_37_15]|nr:MAG: hypothetical protein A2Y25_02960 [Candidatus Melainabacteria bacterium GWF2_37_15]